MGCEPQCLLISALLGYEYQTETEALCCGSCYFLWNSFHKGSDPYVYPFKFYLIVNNLHLE